MVPRAGREEMPTATRFSFRPSMTTGRPDADRTGPADFAVSKL